MAGELAGRVAIVTGGASGIGRATAELFVAEGAKVVIADTNEELGDAAAAALGDAAAFRRTDVSDEDDVQALVDFAVEQFGGLHVMFNNAGIGSSFSRFLDEDFADYGRVMAVNLWGVIIGSQRAARHMAAHDGGSIINTASIAALTGGAGPITYRASKAAVVQFSRSIAIDLAEHGIRVNVIAPGHIATAITSYDMGAIIRTTQPLQRHGSSEDVANAVLFLASERAAQITGIVVPVDGGTVAGGPVNQMRMLMTGDKVMQGGPDAG
ncbi:MAG: SDR family oxidoreductase [Acidimicrobiia bacterium]|jgi:NAD(P)-dependent dehydrogenase (short-subunit alcohol dehydrogenase family)